MRKILSKARDEDANIMKTKIRKGVIAVAGSGTRFLPATKAQPKEMLPIVDKPIIQYVVEEMVEAGIEDIILVTKWDKKTLEDHFDRSFELEHSLAESGKLKQLEEIRRVSSMANFIYVRQKGPYGNGTPILSASALLNDEPFVFATHPFVNFNVSLKMFRGMGCLDFVVVQQKCSHIFQAATSAAFAFLT